VDNRLVFETDSSGSSFGEDGHLLVQIEEVIDNEFLYKGRLFSLTEVKKEKL